VNVVVHLHQATTERTPDVPEPCVTSILADQAPKLAGDAPELAPPKPTVPEVGSIAMCATSTSPTAQVREGYVKPSAAFDVLFPAETPKTKVGEAITYNNLPIQIAMAR
jgi:hypothetical protein